MLQQLNPEQVAVEIRLVKPPEDVDEPESEIDEMWGAYERHLEVENHEVGKQNMQKIESKHINLRTRIKRLARKTICFSKTTTMHDIVIGLFINRYEFGVSV